LIFENQTGTRHTTQEQRSVSPHHRPALDTCLD
jgi:hypothetical protein